jgi:putative drug exporter of the RND superfamily
VFQWGWDGGLLGIAGAPIEPFIPMILFAIIFGLSMDYEVFLLSRVREEYDRTGDAVESVADGLATTARVITAAAAIMVVVFGSFVAEDDRVVRMLGLGLAVAVLLDVTLVRMLLVPATMELLGARNWWMPRWLDRIVPRVGVEGTDRPDHAPAIVGSGSADTTMPVPVLPGGDAADELERLGERELVGVAHAVRDAGDAVTVGEEPGGNGHAPAGAVPERDFADCVAESSGERRA